MKLEKSVESYFTLMTAVFGGDDIYDLEIFVLSPLFFTI
jgi:hypothetical protein